MNYEVGRHLVFFQIALVDCYLILTIQTQHVPESVEFAVTNVDIGDRNLFVI